jgi:hypothetical protein
VQPNSVEASDLTECVQGGRRTLALLPCGVELLESHAQIARNGLGKVRR